MAVARTFHVAQPALLYIVPATLVPVVVRAWLLGAAHSRLVWGGVAVDEGHGSEALGPSVGVAVPASGIQARDVPSSLITDSEVADGGKDWRSAQRS